jgi:hypothetical protein
VGVDGAETGGRVGVDVNGSGAVGRVDVDAAERCAATAAAAGDMEPCARSVARSTAVGIAEPEKVAGGRIDCARADERVEGGAEGGVNEDGAEEDTIGAEVYAIAGVDVDGSAEGGRVGVELASMWMGWKELAGKAWV